MKANQRAFFLIIYFYLFPFTLPNLYLPQLISHFTYESGIDMLQYENWVVAKHNLVFFFFSGIYNLYMNDLYVAVHTKREISMS